MAVFIQTGVLSPWLVILLAAHAPSLLPPYFYFPTHLKFGSLRPPVCNSIERKKKHNIFFGRQ